MATFERRLNKSATWRAFSHIQARERDSTRRDFLGFWFWFASIGDDKFVKLRRNDRRRTLGMGSRALASERKPERSGRKNQFVDIATHWTVPSRFWGGWCCSISTQPDDETVFFEILCMAWGAWLGAVRTDDTPLRD